MGTRYTHLQSEERLTLTSLIQQSLSLRAIAQAQSQYRLLRTGVQRQCSGLSCFRRAQAAREHRCHLVKSIAEPWLPSSSVTALPLIGYELVVLRFRMEIAH